MNEGIARHAASSSRCYDHNPKLVTTTPSHHYVTHSSTIHSPLLSATNHSPNHPFTASKLPCDNHTKAEHDCKVPLQEWGTRDGR